MTCSNCGAPITPNDPYCAKCGQKQAAAASPPPMPPNMPSYTAGVNQKVNDLGYLLIPLLTFVNIFIWRVFSLLSLSFNSGVYMGMRIFAVLLLAAQFAIALIFVKKPVYKILIAVIFGLVMINSAVDLFQVFSMQF